MPTNFALFLAIVSGFCFLRFLNITRYVSRTWEGPRLILWTGAASAGLLLLSRIIVLALDNSPLAPYFRIIKQIAPWDFSGTIGGAVLLGIALPVAANLFFNQELSSWLASRTVGTRLHHLLFDLVGTGKAICVTMADRKVYVGLVIRTPRLHADERYFELLPVRSGYREKDTGQLHLVVDYSPLVRALREKDSRLAAYRREDFLVLLPFDEVVSARVFDPDIFAGDLFVIEEIAPKPSVADQPYDPFSEPDDP